VRNAASFLKEVWKKPIARITTSLVILSILLINLPLSDLWRTLRQISVGLWLFAVLVFVAGHTVGVIKWWLLINTGENKLSLSKAFTYYFAGLFANLFLPSIAGGDVIRAGLAIRATDEAEAVILGSLLDRFIDVCSLALFIFVGALLSPTVLSVEHRRYLIWVFSLLSIAALGTAVLLFVPIPKAIPQPMQAVISRVRNIVKQLTLRPWRALAALGMALLIQGLFVLLNAFLGTTVGIRLPLVIWFIAWPLAKLSATLPISMGGLGVREAALAVFLGRFGISVSSAVGLGLLWQTVLIAGGAIGGIFYFLTKRGVNKPEGAVATSVAAEDAPGDAGSSQPYQMSFESDGGR
jgi:uncharacterized membrane protein YbhN (UPF0104 family)